MNKCNHRVFLFSMSFITVFVFVLLAFYGSSYYATSFEERFFHAQNETLKPSGSIGHGIGIAGSFFMLFGVFSYMARKRIRMFSRIGILKHWLEFHIFLCTLGSILVFYHTSFKFGRLVSISFWSMVAVVFIGVTRNYAD